MIRRKKKPIQGEWKAPTPKSGGGAGKPGYFIEFLDGASKVLERQIEGLERFIRILP